MPSNNLQPKSAPKAPGAPETGAQWAGRVTEQQGGPAAPAGSAVPKGGGKAPPPPRMVGPPGVPPKGTNPANPNAGRMVPNAAEFRWSGQSDPSFPIRDITAEVAGGAVMMVGGVVPRKGPSGKQEPPPDKPAGDAPVTPPKELKD
jgi:hypothetical protein